MPGEIQTSFIPKAPITASAKPAQSSSVGMMTVISLILALSSVIVFGGTFAYKEVLKKEVDGVKASIASKKADMPLANLKQIEQLNISLNNARNLLNAHVSTNRIFTLLRETTVPPVRYSSFNFDGTEVKIKGSARNYGDVAAQARVFDGMKDKITAFQFSDFTVDKTTNTVTFSLALTVAPEAFRYIAEGNGAVGSTAAPSITATSTAPSAGSGQATTTR